MSRYEESAKANRLFCHRGLGRKHPALSPSKYISAASGCGDMGGDHYAAMELLNNLDVAMHKKPRDIEVVERARSNKSPGRGSRVQVSTPGYKNTALAVQQAGHWRSCV